MNLRNITITILLTLSIFSVKISSASNLVVEHIASAGIKLTTDNQTVLIDALHSPIHLSSQADIRSLKQLASTSADIVLFTNAENQHFSPKLVSSFMLHNPDSILIGTQKAVRKMHGVFNKHRMISLNLGDVESATYQYKDIKVTAINTPLHSNLYTQSYIFLVEIDNFSILHIGGEEIGNTIHSLAIPYSTPIDLAIAPEACMEDENCIEALAQMDIEKVAFTHRSNDETTEVAEQIPAQLTNAVLLGKKDKRIELYQPTLISGQSTRTKLH